MLRIKVDPFLSPVWFYARSTTLYSMRSRMSRQFLQDYAFRESDERQIRIEKNHPGARLFPRSKSEKSKVWKNSWERESGGEMLSAAGGSLAEISCSLKLLRWDLSFSAVPVTLTSPTLIGAGAREERRSYEWPRDLCETFVQSWTCVLVNMMCDSLK